MLTIIGDPDGSSEQVLGTWLLRSLVPNLMMLRVTGAWSFERC